MFSQIRVMDRRKKVAYLVSQQKRTIDLKYLVIQVLTISLVIAYLVVSYTVEL